MLQIDFHGLLVLKLKHISSLSSASLLARQAHENRSATVSRAARDQSQQQLWGGRRKIFDDVWRANVLRLVRRGHSRAPFQVCAVSVGLEKAVKEMLRLMENPCISSRSLVVKRKHGSEFACASIANRKS
jgi:hypothetical protein